MYKEASVFTIKSSKDNFNAKIQLNYFELF